MASLNAKFRRTRRLIDAYLDDLTLGELQKLVEQLQNRRPRWQVAVTPEPPVVLTGDEGTP